jgi:hypothetical protein
LRSPEDEQLKFGDFRGCKKFLKQGFLIEERIAIPGSVIKRVAKERFAIPGRCKLKK